MRHRVVVMCLLFIIIAFISGCASLSTREKHQLQELKAYGINETEIQKKNPAAAGALNLLPGFGNFYLATGTEETGQWLYGLLNILFYPLSVSWGIPQAAIDANTINKKETIYYYTYDIDGKQELEKLKAEATQINQ